MISCPTQGDLERFLAGACSAAEQEEIESHRDACPSCEKWLSEASRDEELYGDVQRVIRAVRASGTASIPVEPPSISRYAILGRLGAGGMGVVYEAEQQNPRRRVALKLLKPGFVTPRALARFEHEAQVLARLDHPGIARILEADTVEVHGERQPFFAMELVEGEPLDRFAGALGLRDRLELLAKVCDAVQHAHQKGVVHRDLKPGNVLVTAEGEPRVLDFGVARTLDDEAVRETLRSNAGEILGTLPYMSPEQVAGQPEEVDTRTDVYALGVLLYELCCGHPPFDVAGRSIPEAARVIAECAAPRMPDVDRDLQTIAAKALEKDKERRYASVAALADDLRRFLDDRPIEARPPSALYQLVKYSRRNRAVVAGFGLAVVLLVGGIVATSVQAVRARRAERLAEEKSEEALADAATEQAANQFLYELLGSNDGYTRPEDYTVSEALARAERRIEARELDDPKVEATIRVALGSTHQRLDEFVEAEAQLRRAVELREEAYGENHRRTAGAVNALGALYHDMGRKDEARELYERALEIYSSAGEGGSAEAGTTLSNLGHLSLSNGDAREAEAYLRRGIEIHRGYADEYPDHLAYELTLLGNALASQGRPEEAERELMAAIAVYEQRPELRTSLGAASPRVFLADFLVRRGRIDEAIELYRQAIDLRIAGRMSRKHLDFVRLVNKLANLFDDLGLPEEAAAVRAELNQDG